MGRDLRTIDHELMYHVTCRGNNRGFIAWDRIDYQSLAGELAKAATRYRWQVLAWCFMTNHYHVLLRTPSGGFSDGFQVMNGSHARRTNRRHGRSDHLFRNRPWSLEVASDAHLVSALIYIARNPVEAGVCPGAADWAFSSYRATVGLAPAPEWLAVETALSVFGATPARASAEFERLVHGRHPLVSDTDGMP
jgi:putative transposase